MVQACDGGRVGTQEEPLPLPLPHMHMRVHTGKHTHAPQPPAPPLPLLCRLFTFSRLHNKGLTPADIGVMATHVVLSALAIMPYDQVGVEKLKQQR